MFMMTSKTLKSKGFTKTQNSRYLESETFFRQIKKFIGRLSSLPLFCFIPLKNQSPYFEKKYHPNRYSDAR